MSARENIIMTDELGDSLDRYQCLCIIDTIISSFQRSRPDQKARGL